MISTCHWVTHLFLDFQKLQLCLFGFAHIGGSTEIGLSDLAPRKLKDVKDLKVECGASLRSTNNYLGDWEHKYVDCPTQLSLFLMNYYLFGKVPYHDGHLSQSCFFSHQE